MTVLQDCFAVLTPNKQIKKEQRIQLTGVEFSLLELLRESFGKDFFKG